jgi:hypothetical protein
MSNTLLSSIVAPSNVVLLTATQTISNKTLTSPVLSGTVTAGGSVGTAGQVLSSTGTGVQWINAGGGSGTAGGIFYVYARATTISVTVNVGNLAVNARSGTVNVTI